MCFVQLMDNEDGLHMSIEDNGEGFDFSTVEMGQGLKSIDKRLKNINGVLKIESKIGSGSLFIIRLNYSA